MFCSLVMKITHTQKKKNYLYNFLMLYFLFVFINYFENYSTLLLLFIFLQVVVITCEMFFFSFEI